ncbi:cancer-related nucleoside-triphosphatase homolog isoform X1 [Chenopodium quinoa]|uniref:AAA+ ATPase domain-containing protein n=1 Tax=Chenopodium quinoa TaxID=63459 RepID=A0A803L9I1_CHEQI|nr:cancer-related nucleoside-triphosphatase homolog isoform X1 [Chenopodium quinoa]
MVAPGKCILVSGAPGVGKTTLIIRVLENLRALNPNLKVQGFYTREIRQGNERVGFEVVTVNGQRGTLASINNPSPESVRWPTVGRYRVDIASFDNIALPVLQIKEDTDLFVIDEVGKMELYSSSFFPAVLNLLNSNIPLLATIPIARHGRDIPGVARLRNHPGAIIYTLDPNNRDTYRERVYSHLVDLFTKS